MSGSLQGCDASALPSELDDLSGVLRELLQRGAVFAPMRCSPLGRFTQQLREWSLSASQGFAAEDKATCARSPFPCPLPFPEAERRQHAMPASGRRRGRFKQELAARRWVNQVFSYFSFLTLGSPKDFQQVAPRISRRPSTLVRELASSMCKEIRCFLRSGASAAAESLDGGRKRLQDALAQCKDKYSRGPSLQVEDMVRSPGSQPRSHCCP